MPKTAPQYDELANQPGQASHATTELGGVGDTKANSPKLDSEGKPTQRAITSAKQAFSIAKGLKDAAVQDQRSRINVAAIIAAKYNGEAPFPPAELAASGEAWRNNFSTQYLASVIDRVKPQLLDPLHKTDLLTHSALPPEMDGAAVKSRKFCEVTTKVIRRWSGWSDFCSGLIQELVCYGVATPAWISHKTEWRPHLWRFEESFFPEGTGQHASNVVYAVFKQEIPLNEFVNLLNNKAAAVKAGYNWENCIKAANQMAASSTDSTEETALDQQDRLRETGNLANTYAAAKVSTVDVYHVAVVDYTKEVDLWTVLQTDGMELRNVQGLHNSSEDTTTLFTFQSGNSKLYGSKGLGRLLVNLHIAIERGRCLAFDQMYLAGLPILKTPDRKNAAKLSATVRHPFIWVDQDAELLEEMITFNAETFAAMDQKLTTIADSIAGAFIPPNLTEKGANTKIEAAQNAEREIAVKAGVVGRFLRQAGDLVSTVQRKIYGPLNLREGKRAYDAKKAKQASGIKIVVQKVWKIISKALRPEEIKMTEPQNIPPVADEDAVSAVIELLEAGLTIEEIATLALMPSANTTADEGAEKDGKTLEFITANRTNPHIDQRKASEMEANIVLGEDRAKQLITPLDDPNVKAIAVRQQIIELGEMLAGEMMPVSGTDAHDIHLRVLAERYPPLRDSALQSPTQELLTTTKLLIKHQADHINANTMMPLEDQKAAMDVLSADWKAIAKLEQDAAQAAATGQSSPFNLPKPVGGTPLVTPPTGGPQSEMTAHPQDVAVKLELHKLGQKDAELDMRQQEIELKSKDQEHRQAMDTIGSQQKNADIIQRTESDVASLQAQKAAQEAERELRKTEAKAAANKPAAK